MRRRPTKTLRWGISSPIGAWRDIGRTDGLSLAERRLVQPDFPADRMGGLLVTQDESLSLLVNGEDHLRIQVFRAGMELESAYAEADHLDTDLG